MILYVQVTKGDILKGAIVPIYSSVNSNSKVSCGHTLGDVLESTFVWKAPNKETVRFCVG